MSKPIQLSPHFTSAEFTCSHCGQYQVDMRLVNGLEELRKLAGNKPLKINSAYRCKEHNEAIGGAKNSMHITGMAADVAVPKGYNTVSFASLAARIPQFRDGGIGIYVDANIIHVDVRPDGPARWSRIAGKYASFEAGVAAMTKKGKA